MKYQNKVRCTYFLIFLFRDYIKQCKMVSHFEKEYREYKKMNKFAGDYGDGIKTKFDMEVRERIRNNVKEKEESKFCLCNIQFTNDQNYKN